ncbi:MAG: hypothetical protein KIT54_04115 [Phycisphaeraceae bacterium]|nr:hypothetical protein [Phycisphaeraceae bacterium]
MSGVRVAMEWHAGWLTAVAVGREKGRPRLGKVVCARLPESVSAEDAQAVGLWVGEQLRQAGLAGKPVAWVAGRGDVLLKRLSLPKPPVENQLPAMVRLQMARAMPVAGTDAATDYAVLGQQDDTLDLLGASVPAERLEWMRSMLSAGKLKLGMVVLRAQCSACLAGFPDEGKARIVVSPGASSVEVVVLEPGGVVTSRGIDATWPAGDQEGFVRRIAVEVKRTWMGYRSSSASLAVASAVVLGGSALCESIAQAVGEAIEAPATTLGHDGLIVTDDPSQDPARWLAMGGLGVAMCERVDLLNPKRGKATRSKVRERALLAVMGVVAVVGGSGAWAYVRLGDLESQAAALERQRTSLQNDYAQMLLLRSRVDHLRALRDSRPQWTGHLERVMGHVTAEGVRLDVLSGVSRGGVWFGDLKDQRSFSFVTAEYRPDVRGLLSVQGVVEHRELAGMVRGRLVNDPLYLVQTQGPDAGDGLKLDVLTTHRVAGDRAEAATGGGP